MVRFTTGRFSGGTPIKGMSCHGTAGHSKGRDMSAPEYRHLVEVDGGPPKSRGRLYDGPDAADAMAVWSKAIADGALYVTLESLVVSRRQSSPPKSPRAAAAGD
jgi:hypothetical protein